MQTALNIEMYTLEIPKADARLLSALVKKMGWTKKKIKVKKTGLDFALEDIEKGNLKSFDNVDALMDYLRS